ncbi:hypothetical protein ACFLXP_04755 [Chloroflexota bacterium]
MAKRQVKRWAGGLPPAPSPENNKMTDPLKLENGENPKGSRNKQVARSEAECKRPVEENNDSLLQYTPGTSHLVDYAIEHFGAEVINIENLPKTRPPFPCLTGASNTSNSYKIDKNKYPNIVAAGIDTLELNFGVAEYRYPDMFQILSDTKSEVVSAGYKGRRGLAIDWFGQEFMVQARGSSAGYEYLLKNGDIELRIMPNARGGNPSPEIRVIFRSQYLWRMGEIPAYNKIIEFINEWVFVEYCKVSRADLCVDMVMPLPEIHRMTQVVSLARSKDLYYGGDFQRGQRETGYQFGRGDITCRLYDKVYEMSVKGNNHIIPIWMANGWDGESTVSRFEPQLRRGLLRQFDTNMDFATFQDSKPDIWSYVTEKYIRLIDPGSATRRENAETTPYWKDYQSCAELFGERRGVLPYKQLSPDWKPLIKQASGCLASAWARLAADMGEDEAMRVLENAWGQLVPDEVIIEGLRRKAQYMHLRLI